MKVNQDYIKSLLMAFQDVATPTITVRQLQDDFGFDLEDSRFFFHMGILVDKGLLIREDRQLGFGTSYGLDGSIHWIATPLRLTASGHEFADALRNPQVWNKTKAGLEKAGGFGVEIMLSVAKAYSKEVIKETLGLNIG